MQNIWVRRTPSGVDRKGRRSAKGRCRRGNDLVQPTPATDRSGHPPAPHKTAAHFNWARRPTIRPSRSLPIGSSEQHGLPPDLSDAHCAVAVTTSPANWIASLRPGHRRDRQTNFNDAAPSRVAASDARQLPSTVLSDRRRTARPGVTARGHAPRVRQAADRSGEKFLLVLLTREETIFASRLLIDPCSLATSKSARSGISHID